MAINAGDILYYNGSAWVNYPGVQAGASGFSVIGNNDAIQLVVQGINNQGNELVNVSTIQTFAGAPSNPYTQAVLEVLNNGQTSLTYFDDNQTGLGDALRLTHMTAEHSSLGSGFGIGVQFFGQNTSGGLAQVAAIQVYQQGFAPGLENASLQIFTTKTALSCLWNGNVSVPNSLGIGTNAPSHPLHVSGGAAEFDGDGNQIFVIGGLVSTAAANAYYGKFPVNIPGIGTKYIHLFN